MIGRNGERRSGISAQTARHDDDDDDDNGTIGGLESKRTSGDHPYNCILKIG